MLYILASGLLQNHFHIEFLAAAMDEDMNPFHPTNASHSHISFTFNVCGEVTKNRFSYNLNVHCISEGSTFTNAASAPHTLQYVGAIPCYSWNSSG
ncbi:hypothetical protein L6452_45214 [Arctium lappa]|nr:hypothetical protein L6452_45214 [Arctium lappa]